MFGRCVVIDCPCRLLILLHWFQGIFVTKVLEEGPALGSLVAGDKIIQVGHKDACLHA